MRSAQTSLVRFNVAVRKDILEMAVTVTMLMSVKHQHTRVITMLRVQTHRGPFAVSVRSGILVQACIVQISMNVYWEYTIVEKTPCALIMKVHLIVNVRMATSTVTMSTNVWISMNVNRVSTPVDITYSAKIHKDHFYVSTTKIWMHSPPRT